MQGSIITIGIGRAGVQIARSAMTYVAGAWVNQPSADTPCFGHMSTGLMSPRLILADHDPIDGRRIYDQNNAAPTHQQISPDAIVAGTESGHRQYMQVAEQHIPVKTASVLDKIRKAVDAASSVEAFVVVFATSGGTGGAFTPVLLNRLKRDYPSVKRIGMALLPDLDFDPSPLDAINTGLALEASLPLLDLCLLADNDAASVIERSTSRTKLDRRIGRGLGTFLATVDGQAMSASNIISRVAQTGSDNLLLMAHLDVSGARTLAKVGRALGGGAGALASCPKTAWRRRAGGTLMVARGTVKNKELAPAITEFAKVNRASVHPVRLPVGELGRERQSMHVYMSHGGVGDLLEDRVVRSLQRSRRAGKFLHHIARDHGELPLVKEAVRMLSVRAKRYRAFE